MFHSCTHWDQVLFHEWSQHVVPDGGHDVAEVQGGDGATFALVFLRKRLAGMLKLQLLHTHSHVMEVKAGAEKNLFLWWAASHYKGGGRVGETLEDERRAAWRAGQMCRTDVTVSHAGFFGNHPPTPHPTPPHLPLTHPPIPPPAGTNGNHVTGSLIPEMSPGATRRDGWQVCRAGRVIQYDAAAIRPVTPESEPSARAHQVWPPDHTGPRQGHVQGSTLFFSTS